MRLDIHEATDKFNKNRFLGKNVRGTDRLQ